MAVATAAVVATAVTAYSAYDAKQQQKKQAGRMEEEFGKPSTSQLSPWEPTEDPIRSILDDAFAAYQRGPALLAPGGGLMYGGGGGGPAPPGGGTNQGAQQGDQRVGKWRKHDPADLAEFRIQNGRERPGDRALLEQRGRQVPGSSPTPGGPSTPAGPDNSREGLIGRLADGPSGPDVDALRGFGDRVMDPGYRGNAVQTDLQGRMGGVTLDRAGSHFDRWVGSPESYYGDGGQREQSSAGQSSGAYGSPGSATSRGTAHGGGGSRPTAGQSFGYGYAPGERRSSGRQGGAQAEMDFFLDDARLDPADDPTMQSYLDALEREALERREDDLNLVAGRYDRGGMFGSSLRALEQGGIRDDYEENLLNANAAALFGARNDALDRRLDATGMMSGAELTREQIAAQRAASASAAAASRYGTDKSYDLGMAGLDLERALGFRGQDIGIAQNLMSNDQFGLGMLGGIGADVANQQMGAAGQLGGLAQLGGGMLSDAAGLQNQFGIADAQNRTQRGIANAGRGLQRDMFNANAQFGHLNDYLSLFMGPGATFGQRNTTGPNPYLGAAGAVGNPWVAGLGAGASTFAGAANAGAFRGGG